jgi:hypothetical protein
MSRARTVIIIVFFCFGLYGVFYPRVSSKTQGPGPTSTPKTTPTPKPKIKGGVKASVAADFRHDGKRHSKIACDSCHKFPSANWKSVRKDKEAFPDITEYPKHASCLQCHRKEFFGSPKPSICTICHTNPVPGNSSRHPFPNPREIFDQSPKGKEAVSDFAISFPHDKHIEIVSAHGGSGGEIVNASFSGGRKRAGEESCAVCHQTYQPQGKSDTEFVTKPPEKLGDAFWLKLGTFKTAPTGHATCFTCHSSDTGILPLQENCATCHKLAEKLPASDFDPQVAAAMGELDKITVASWRKRDSSATFRHEGHADLECANCHTAASIVTTDFKTEKVAVTSCNMCHITETSDDGGILNFEIDSRKKNAAFQCVKCHIAFGKLPVPESHNKAVQAAAGK